MAMANPEEAASGWPRLATSGAQSEWTQDSVGKFGKSSRGRGYREMTNFDEFRGRQSRFKYRDENLAPTRWLKHYQKPAAMGRGKRQVLYNDWGQEPGQKRSTKNRKIASKPRPAGVPYYASPRRIIGLTQTLFGLKARFILLPCRYGFGRVFGAPHDQF